MYAPVIKSTDRHYLSSTQIRAGKIDRQGNLFRTVFQKDLFITGSLRRYLQQPHGEFCPSISPNTIDRSLNSVIAWVGDMVGKEFIDQRIPFNLGIFDLRNKQQVSYDLLPLLKEKSLQKVYNPAGCVKLSIIPKLAKLVTIAEKDILSSSSQFLKASPSPKKKKHFLYVQGEEDLLVVPLILLLPLRAEIYYGYKNQGIYKIVVTEEWKEALRNKLQRIMR